jgi:hypothetical protein
VFLNGICGLRKGKKMKKMTKEVGSQKCKGHMKTWEKYELSRSEIED